MHLTEFVRDVYAARRPDLSPSGLDQLSVAVRRLGEYLMRPAALDDLTDGTIQSFLVWLKSTHAAATCNSKRRQLLTLWRAAWRWGYLDQPPRDVPKLREPRRIPEAWTLAEIEQLVAHCRTINGYIGHVAARYYWPSLVLATWCTGCRVTALRATSPADCSLGERWLIVRAEHTKTQTDQLYWLSDQAIAAIAPIHDRSQLLLWPWPHARAYFWRRFRRIVETSGLTANRRGMDLFHRIRRSTVSYTARAGGLDLARRVAGHSDARLTTRHYVDPRIADERRAVDVLPELRF
jgi:hypothetical protein